MFVRVAERTVAYQSSKVALHIVSPTTQGVYYSTPAVYVVQVQADHVVYTT